MNEVRLTPGAMDDLLNIKTYISQSLKNPIAAKSVERRIIDGLRSLESFSGAGVSLDIKTEKQDSNMRMLSCGDYLAFYRVNGNVVSIIRILNGRQNYMTILFGDK